MPIPATATTMATAREVYQRYGCCSTRTRTLAKVIGWYQILFNMLMTYSTYFNVVRLWCSSGRLRETGETNALFVLFNINGLIMIFGVFLGIIFLRGATSGDMNDLNRYGAFALFSILIHLNVLFAFVILEVWVFVLVSVACLLMHVAGLLSAACIDLEIKMIGKLLILEQLVGNKKEELGGGAPPPYSTLVV